MFYKLAFSIFFIIIFVSCKKDNTSKLSCIQADKGIASWYGPGFQGKLTASGEKFDMYDYTAAHRKLKFGTLLRITNTKNNLSVIVRINDRGPFNFKRVVDISKISAKNIDMINSGTATVKIEITGYRHIDFRNLYKHYRNLLILKSQNTEIQ